MEDLRQIKKPKAISALICFSDIDNFSKTARQLESLELFKLMQEVADITAKIIEDSCGYIIKYIGDSSLIIYSGGEVDAGVKALLSLKRETEGYFRSRGFDNSVSFSLHCGEVIVGKLKPFDTIDVIGDAVQIAFTLNRGKYRGSFVISPQVFRKLDPAMRKMFHKFTPPIVYRAD